MLYTNANATVGIGTMPKPFDTELKESLKRGYIAAFRMLGNPDESRDACQEAAARALSASKRYDASKPFYPWFYRILKNLCIDRIKHRKREPLRPSEPEQTVDKQKSVESQMLQHEQTQMVGRAIEKLPEELREIIELRHFQDLSYQEMASILSCPLGTIMSRLYRARKTLRHLLLEDPSFRQSTKQGENDV